MIRLKFKVQIPDGADLSLRFKSPMGRLAWRRSNMITDPSEWQKSET